MSGASPSDVATGDRGPRKRRVLLLVAGALAVLVLIVGVAVALSAGDDGGGDETTESTSSTSPPSTEPPGTDPAEVQPYLEELVARLDSVTDEIVRDPSVVNDPNSELIREFTSLYAPNAEGLAGGINAFKQSAAAGTHLEPVDSATTGTTVVTGAVQSIDENKVKVSICSHSTYRKLDANGSVVEYIGSLSQPGEVFAIRVEGKWRLERSDVFGNTICTADEGEAA